MKALIIGTTIALMACLTGVASAQQTDVIRGTVTGPDSLPVSGVEVRATSYAGGVTKTAQTDKSGRYMIAFINGEGDYWLDFRKLGYAPRRFEVKRIGDEEVLLGNTRLSSTIAALDAVNVTAQRDRALPNRNSNPDVGGGERPLTNNTVTPDQAGNLAAMAAGVAGIQLVPGFDGAADMFTLLGLTPDQNSTLFNGLGSGISALPPDILASTSIVPYSFDPAIGGFSGAQINIATIPGSNFSRRLTTNNSIAPALEWADSTAEAQGQRYASIRFGGNAAGPLSMDKMFYNGAYNVQRRFNDVHSLLNTNPAGLAAAGVAPDSAARLLRILGQQGIPLSVAAVPSLQSQDAAQLVTNVDWMPSASGAGHSFVFSAAGNYQRSQPVSRGGLLLATPTHGGQTDFWGANLAAVHMNYFWFGILSKTTVGFAGSGTSTEPYVRMPEGSVRVSSSLPDGSASVKSLVFGGNSALSSLNNRTLQATNRLSWYTGDNRHTLRVATSIARDWFRSDASPSLLGTYSFNSLVDLEAGRASSFARTIAAATQSGAQITASASLGDYWRPSDGLQVQYGLRLDGNRFSTAPAFNAALNDSLGLRNDKVPNRVYVSPRVGLQWYYGSSPQVAYAPGAARPPRAVIHAGFGLFQNLASARLISPAVLATGLPSSTQNILCVGGAVPFPAWDDFVNDPASIPTRCADGSAGSVFSTGAPNVSVFAPGYRQPYSLRGAADWSGPVLDNRFVFGVQTVISSGMSQSGFVDANLNPTARFTLANEANRPIFADAGAIVPTTGSVAIASSRRSPSFQHVALQESNLRVSARQLTVNLKPVTANPRLRWDFSYTLLDARERVNGFTSTVGNPFETSWAPTQAGRHSFTLSWSNFPLFDVAYLTVLARVVSGEQYTPMIAGDVNGDGYLNDRAFIFDPATVPAMRALLDGASAATRRCLQNQLRQLSALGSCQAPWSANGALALKFNPAKIGLPKRLTAQLTLSNPLAVADIAIHGRNEIHGWGQDIPPDANLLYVRGFDPATRQFRYDVNQRFGSTRPQQATTRALPFLSFGLSLDIGMTRERQLLTQRLDLGRAKPGNRQMPEAMKQLGTQIIPNPMNMILQQQESLGLTRVQADSLAMLSYRFALFADSIWTPVSNELAGLPERYDHGSAYRRYVTARERTVDYLLTLVSSAKELLTPSQRRKLPPQISNYLDERVLRFLRSSSAGDGSSLVIH